MLQDVLAGIGGALGGAAQGMKFSYDAKVEQQKLDAQRQLQEHTLAIREMIANMQDARYDRVSANTAAQQAGEADRAAKKNESDTARANKTNELLSYQWQHPSANATLGSETTRRGQDMTSTTAQRGQDMSSSTARRGQDLTAGTAQRGQDIGAATSIYGGNLRFQLGEDANNDTNVRAANALAAKPADLFADPNAPKPSPIPIAPRSNVAPPAPALPGRTGGGSVQAAPPIVTGGSQAPGAPPPVPVDSLAHLDQMAAELAQEMRDVTDPAQLKNLAAVARNMKAHRAELVAAGVTK
jgi:hypothetical protein